MESSRLFVRLLHLLPPPVSAIRREGGKSRPDETADGQSLRRAQQHGRSTAKRTALAVFITFLSCLLLCAARVSCAGPCRAEGFASAETTYSAKRPDTEAPATQGEKFVRQETSPWSVPRVIQPAAMPPASTATGELVRGVERRLSMATPPPSKDARSGKGAGEIGMEGGSRGDDKSIIRSSCPCCFGLDPLVREALGQFSRRKSPLGEKLRKVRAFVVVTVSSLDDSILLLKSPKSTGKKKSADRKKGQAFGRSCDDAACSDGIDEIKGKEKHFLTEHRLAAEKEEEAKAVFCCRGGGNGYLEEGAAPRAGYWQLPGGRVDNADAAAVLAEMKGICSGAGAVQRDRRENVNRLESHSRAEDVTRGDQENSSSSGIRESNPSLDSRPKTFADLEDVDCRQMLPIGGEETGGETAVREDWSSEGCSSASWEDAVAKALLLIARHAAARELFEETGISAFEYKSFFAPASATLMPSGCCAAAMSCFDEERRCTRHSITHGSDGWRGHSDGCVATLQFLFSLGKTGKEKNPLSRTPPKYFFSFQLRQLSACESTASPSSPQRLPLLAAEGSPSPSSSSSILTGSAATARLEGTETNEQSTADKGHNIRLSSEHESLCFVKSPAAAAEMVRFHSGGDCAKALSRLPILRQKEG